MQTRNFSVSASFSEIAFGYMRLKTLASGLNCSLSKHDLDQAVLEPLILSTIYFLLFLSMQIVTRDDSCVLMAWENQFKNDEEQIFYCC